MTTTNHSAITYNHAAYRAITHDAHVDPDEIHEDIAAFLSGINARETEAVNVDAGNLSFTAWGNPEGTWTITPRTA